MPPRLVFGAASLGDSFISPESVIEVLETLKSAGVSHIDTAGRYPSSNPGLSETLLGKTDAAGRGFTLDTKILAASGDGGGELSEKSIDASLSSSLGRLGVKEVNTLYCHRPDPRTPLEEQAAALDKHYRDGHFKRLGVSNFSPEQLKEFLRICNDKGYVAPTVYQGNYSAVERGMERNLLPLLRTAGITYYAFRPLSSGLLTGNFTRGNYDGTRFDTKNPLGNSMQALFNTPKLHSAINLLLQATEEAGISLTEASLRWLVWHSALNENDAIIFGASKVRQIESNLSAFKQGPLDGNLAAKFEEAWDLLERQG